MKQKDTEGFNVGDIRISYRKADCGPVSLLSQQIQDEDHLFTFQSWYSDDTYVDPLTLKLARKGFLRVDIDKIEQQPVNVAALFD